MPKNPNHHLKTLATLLPIFIRTRLYIDNHSAAYQPIRIEHETSRQPIRIEHVSSRQHDKTRQHPRSESRGGRPFSALGSSRVAIAYVKTWGVFHPHLISLLLLLVYHFPLKTKVGDLCGKQEVSEITFKKFHVIRESLMRKNKFQKPSWLLRAIFLRSGSQKIHSTKILLKLVIISFSVECMCSEFVDFG